MAVRMMVAGSASCLDGEMDEATLECSFCGAPARIEFVQQLLADTAEWSKLCGHRVCQTCLDKINLAAWIALPPGARLIVSRL